MAIIGFRHIGLKIMSIALAALLWLVVAGEQVVERALRIPLEFTNMPAQLEPVGEPPNVVDVRLRGSSGRLSRIAAGEVVAVVDLQGARPGQRLFHVSASDIRAPFGVEVRAGGALEPVHDVRAVGHEGRADRSRGGGRSCRWIRIATRTRSRQPST
jgi:hypothetical protein